jgi:hypothetical protein
MSRKEATSVGALDRGKVPSLPLRLTLSTDRVMFVVNGGWMCVGDKPKRKSQTNSLGRL